MIFYSGGTHYIRRPSTFLWNGGTPGVAGQFYNWCPEGTTIEIVDFFFDSCLGMKATKMDGKFVVTDNPNNGTISFLIANPDHPSPNITNRLAMYGSQNPNAQYHPAKWKVEIPEIVGTDGNASLDVNDLFLIPEGYEQTEQNWTPEPPIDWDSYHPLDFNQDGIVNIFDAQIAAAQHGEVVAQMVVRHMMNQNPWDLNGDGGVNIFDIQAAIAASAPQHIIQHITHIVMNPPPPTQDYNPEPPVQEDGSGYHPLDINQDGEVSISDIVAVTSNPDFSQITKTLIVNMILRYMDGICPYDVNQDGTINILDVQHCAANGVPQNIVMDVLANVGTAVPLPEVEAPPPPPVDPGPLVTTNNLWMPQGSWGLLNGTPYYGPVHKHANNLGHYYMTEYVHKNHSRLLIPLVDNPEEALSELPSGALTPAPENPSENMFSNLTDLNGDGIVNVLDQVMQNQQNNTTPPVFPDFSNLDLNLNLGNILGGGGFNFGSGFGSGFNFGGSSGNNTGGSGNNNNNNNQNNSGGSGGGGGAY